MRYQGYHKGYQGYHKGYQGYQGYPSHLVLTNVRYSVNNPNILNNPNLFKIKVSTRAAKFRCASDGSVEL